MYCMNCGAEITNTSARFCYQCGKEIIHNQSRIDLNDSEPMQEKAANDALQQKEQDNRNDQIREGQVACEDRAKQEQPICKVSLMKAERRRIINLSKRRIESYIPRIKEALNNWRNGKYWVFLKIGELKKYEAFGLVCCPLQWFSGADYVGCCIDLHIDYADGNKQRLCDRLLLVVEKDDFGVHLISYDVIDDIKQTGLLSIVTWILLVVSTLIAVMVLLVGGLGFIETACSILFYFLLYIVAGNLPFKKGKII